MQIRRANTDKLGEGTYATVYQGTVTSHDDKAKSAAIKVFSVDKLPASLITNFSAIQSFRFPFIIQTLSSLIIEGKEAYYALPLMQGDLLAKLLTPDSFTWSFKLQIIGHLIEAIAYLHSQHYAHRDIKPKNILLSANGDAVLSDLDGIARVDAKDEKFATREGSLLYIAPELLNGQAKNKDLMPTDIYSFGITVMEMITGPLLKIPDLATAVNNEVESKRNAAIEKLITTPDGETSEYVTLIDNQVLTVDTRPNGIDELFTPCVRFDPLRRPTIMQVHYQFLDIEYQHFVAEKNELHEKAELYFNDGEMMTSVTPALIVALFSTATDALRETAVTTLENAFKEADQQREAQTVAHALIPYATSVKMQTRLESLSAPVALQDETLSEPPSRSPVMLSRCQSAFFYRNFITRNISRETKTPLAVAALIEAMLSGPSLPFKPF